MAPPTPQELEKRYTGYRTFLLSKLDQGSCLSGSQLLQAFLRHEQAQAREREKTPRLVEALRAASAPGGVGPGGPAPSSAYPFPDLIAATRKRRSTEEQGQGGRQDAAGTGGEGEEGGQQDAAGTGGEGEVAESPDPGPGLLPEAAGTCPSEQAGREPEQAGPGGPDVAGVGFETEEEVLGRPAADASGASGDANMQVLQCSAGSGGVSGGMAATGSGSGSGLNNRQGSVQVVPETPPEERCEEGWEEEGEAAGDYEQTSPQGVGWMPGVAEESADLEHWPTAAEARGGLRGRSPSASTGHEVGPGPEHPSCDDGVMWDRTNLHQCQGGPHVPLDQHPTATTAHQRHEGGPAVAAPAVPASCSPAEDGGRPGRGVGLRRGGGGGGGGMAEARGGKGGDRCLVGGGALLARPASDDL